MSRRRERRDRPMYRQPRCESPKYRECEQSKKPAWYRRTGLKRPKFWGPKDEDGSAYTLAVLIVSVIAIGLMYTVMYGVLGAFPAGPATATMQFLSYTLSYFMVPVFIIIIMWYLNRAAKD